MATATTPAKPGLGIRWITRGGASGWVCLGCGTSGPGDRQTSQSDADRHDCTKVRLLRELAAANRAIEAAGAVMTERDGFQWVDESKAVGGFHQLLPRPRLHVLCARSDLITGSQTRPHLDEGLPRPQRAGLTERRWQRANHVV